MASKIGATILYPFESCVNIKVEGAELTNESPLYDSLCAVAENWDKFLCKAKARNNDERFSVGHKDRNEVVVWIARKKTTVVSDGYKKPDETQEGKRVLYVNPELPYNRESWLILTKVCKCVITTIKKQGQILTEETSSWKYFVQGPTITKPADLKIEKANNLKLSRLPVVVNLSLSRGSSKMLPALVREESKGKSLIAESFASEKSERKGESEDEVEPGSPEDNDREGFRVVDYVNQSNNGED